MENLSTKMTSFFSVAVRPQTYLNALYLLLAFPLGLFYFIFLVTGLALGLSLVIVWVGLLILALVYGSWLGLAAFERQMAVWLLREDIPPMVRPDTAARFAEMSLWQKFTSSLSNPVTWKSLVYLAAKFPLGIVSFVALVTLLSVSAALIGTPFFYQYNLAYIHYGPEYRGWVIDTPFEAGLAFLAGLALLFVSMHVLNGLAWFSGKFARVMLGNFQPVPAESEGSEPGAPAQAEIIAPQVYETADALTSGAPVPASE